jgi:hypothetical protein
MPGLDPPNCDDPVPLNVVGPPAVPFGDRVDLFEMPSLLHVRYSLPGRKPGGASPIDGRAIPSSQVQEALARREAGEA